MAVDPEALLASRGFNAMTRALGRNLPARLQVMRSQGRRMVALTRKPRPRKG